VVIDPVEFGVFMDEDQALARRDVPQAFIARG